MDKMDYSKIKEFFDEYKQSSDLSLMDGLILSYLVSLGYAPATRTEKIAGQLRFSEDRKSITAIPDDVGSLLQFTEDDILDVSYSSYKTVVIVEDDFKIYQPRFGKYILFDEISFNGDPNDERLFKVYDRNVFDLSTRKVFPDKLKYTHSPSRIYEVNADILAFENNHNECLLSLIEIFNDMINQIPKENLISFLKGEYSRLFNYADNDLEKNIIEDYKRRVEKQKKYKIIEQSEYNDLLKTVSRQKMTIDSLKNDQNSASDDLSEIFKQNKQKGDDEVDVSDIY